MEFGVLVEVGSEKLVRYATEEEHDLAQEINGHRIIILNSTLYHVQACVCESLHSVEVLSEKLSQYR